MVDINTLIKKFHSDRKYDARKAQKKINEMTKELQETTGNVKLNRYQESEINGMRLEYALLQRQLMQLYLEKELDLIKEFKKQADEHTKD